MGTNNPHFIIRKESFGGILYDKSSFQYYSLENEGFSLLEFLKENGYHNTRIKYQNDEEALELIKDLLNLGLTPDELSNLKITEYDAVDKALSMPLKAYLTVTERCNLRCKHCFGAFGNPVEMSLEQVEYILNELEKAGVCQIGLTGGEPFYHPDIYKIIDLIIEHGFTLQTTTNGLLIDQKFIDSFKKYGSKFFRLSISIDGLPQDHDAIRGAGNYEALKKKMDLLKENQIPFAFNYVINNKNFDSFSKFLDYQYNEGNHCGSFTWIIPTGRAKDNSEFILDPNDHWAAKSKHIKQCIIDFAKRTGKMQYMYGGSIWPDGSITYEENDIIHELGIKRCAAGASIITISADGKLLPCIFAKELLERRGLHSESIFDHSLAQIWRTNDQFIFMRNLDANTACKKCELYGTECTGGCPAESDYFTNEVDAFPPYCSIR